MKRVLHIVEQIIGNMLYGRKPKEGGSQRSGNPKSPHITELCEACQSGECTENREWRCQHYSWHVFCRIIEKGLQYISHCPTGLLIWTRDNHALREASQMSITRRKVGYTVGWPKDEPLLHFLEANALLCHKRSFSQRLGSCLIKQMTTGRRGGWIAGRR